MKFDILENGDIRVTDGEMVRDISKGQVAQHYEMLSSDLAEKDVQKLQAHIAAIQAVENEG